LTGNPFSNVLGTDQDSSRFKDVESTQTTDTTSETAARPPDSDTESSIGVEVVGGVTHESGQDETAGDESSGTNTSLT
jgi:hypothetical protein